MLIKIIVIIISHAAIAQYHIVSCRNKNKYKTLKAPNVKRTAIVTTVSFVVGSGTRRVETLPGNKSACRNNNRTETRASCSEVNHVFTRRFAKNVSTFSVTRSRRFQLASGRSAFERPRLRYSRLARREIIVIIIVTKHVRGGFIYRVPRLD